MTCDLWGQKGHLLNFNGLYRTALSYFVAVLLSANSDRSAPASTEMDQEQVKSIDPKKLRHISVKDFTDSLKRIRRSVDAQTLAQYEKFEREYGEIRT